MSNEDYGVSDAGHVGMAFDALTASLDRLNGSESYSLVPAQVYVYSILEADGALSRAERVAGNESFFGAIGNGLQAVWDFIAKLFKGIWNFFFGSSDDAIAKKETAAITRVESNAEEMKKRHQELDDQIAKNKAENKADDEEAAKKKAERDAKWKKEEEEWEAMNGKRRAELSDLVDKAERTSQKLTAIADPSEEGKYKGTTFENLHDELHIALGKMEHVDRDKVLRKAISIDGFVKALESQFEVKKYLGRMKDARVPLDRIKSNLQSAISDLEKRVKATKKNDKELPKLKSDLAAGKEFLQALVKLNQYLEDAISDCVKFSNWLKTNYVK
jgi:hypothetical protein